jgi:hypothetical protein
LDGEAIGFAVQRVMPTLGVSPVVAGQSAAEVGCCGGERGGVGNGRVVWRVLVRPMVDSERPFVIPKCAILSLNLIR